MDLWNVEENTDMDPRQTEEKTSTPGSSSKNEEKAEEKKETYLTQAEAETETAAEIGATASEGGHIPMKPKEKEVAKIPENTVVAEEEQSTSSNRTKFGSDQTKDKRSRSRKPSPPRRRYERSDSRAKKRARPRRKRSRSRASSPEVSRETGRTLLAAAAKMATAKLEDGELIIRIRMKSLQKKRKKYRTKRTTAGKLAAQALSGSPMNANAGEQTN